VKLLALLGALALAGALSIPVQAGPNDPLAFGLLYGLNGHHTADPVDYETWCGDCVGVDYQTGTPWVVNPHTSWPYNIPLADFQPGCMWDSDDHYDYINSGSVLAAGVSTSVTECWYAIGAVSADTDIGITSSSSALLVTETFTWDAGSTTVTISPILTTTRAWSYFGCIPLPPTPGGTFQTIPGSNGGTAIPELVTVTVANPTTHKIGQTGGFIESGVQAYNARGCLG